MNYVFSEHSSTVQHLKTILAIITLAIMINFIIFSGAVGAVSDLPVLMAVEYVGDLCLNMYFCKDKLCSTLLHCPGRVISENMI